MIEYWTVENTGWSGGISWFQTGGTDTNPLRFDSYDSAAEYAFDSKKELNQDTTLWRVVHVTFHRYKDGDLTTRKFYFL